jgi:hypothetical protein
MRIMQLLGTGSGISERFLKPGDLSCSTPTAYTGVVGARSRRSATKVSGVTPFEEIV